MSSKLSRRDFIRFSAAGAAGAVLMPSTLATTARAATKKNAASDTINLGFIGLGQQAMYLMQGFLRIPGVRVVAGADLYDVKRERFAQRVNKYYADNKQKVSVKLYDRYEDILARPDIDGVVIATPDHYHALIAIAACRAGKDVYLEKPLTFTIYEGQQLIKAVRENARILQVGSQQRSSPEFLHVANFVREGRLGKISHVKANVGTPPFPRPHDYPAQEVPAGLDWDRWRGPLSWDVPYNERLDPPVSIDPVVNETYWGEWRYIKETGGGLMTDWGAHVFDIAQWALGKDRSGPVEIIPPGYREYDYLTYLYDNGIEMTLRPFDGGKQGCKFYGDGGWIQVIRGEVLASDPAYLPDDANASLAYSTNSPHMDTFIRSMRTRQDPNVSVEVGHSSCTVCTLGNIANELGRPVKWNPIVEKFVGNDAEATARLHYKYREGYSL
jgi:predicted dehydrogenase